MTAYANVQHHELNRVNDIFFKYLLGSEERKNYTLNFLNTTLDLHGEQQFTDLTFSDKELTPKSVQEKLSILDILAITNDGTRVNIEVQVCKDAFMAERALFYWSKIYSRQLQKTETYDTLHKVISLILMDFDFFTQYPDEYHQSYHIVNDGHLSDTLTDHLEMHFIELEKITYTDIKKLKKSDRWIAYFSKRVSDAERKELAEMEPVLKHVIDSEQSFMSDEHLYREYEAREKALRDQLSHIKSAELIGMKQGLEKGIKQGLEKGIKQGLEKGIKQGLEMGYKQKEEEYTQKQLQQIHTLMENLQLSAAQAMDVLGFTAEEKEKYTHLL